MSSNEIDGNELNLLLGLKSRGQFEKCLRLCLVPEGEISQDVVVRTIARTLSMEEDNAEQLRQVEGTVVRLRACVKGILAKGAERYFAELGDSSINPKLKDLLVGISETKMNEWKEASMSGLSLPKLLHHDWTIHKQSASSAVEQMNVPVVLMRLQVEGTPEEVGIIPPVKEVDFELSKEALETMLDGMTKIRDQLSKSVKKKYG